MISLFFTDLCYRGPFIGSMIMALFVSVIGSVFFIQRKNLLSETLSHGAYPGVMLGGLISSHWMIQGAFHGIVFFLLAFLFAVISSAFVHFLQKKGKVDMDAALCAVLALSIGVGVLIASRLQFLSPVLYQEGQLFLYGQAATMGDLHIIIYSILAFVFLVFFISQFRAIQILSFNPSFFLTNARHGNVLFGILYFFLIIAIIVGIRSVGVILMSGLLIAPPAAARFFTDRLSLLVSLAGVFGVVSSFLGNYISVILSRGGKTYPTGPCIVLVAIFFVLCGILLSPKQGIVSKFFRLCSFRYCCQMENLLKMFWKIGGNGGVSKEELHEKSGLSYLSFLSIFFLFKKRGWIKEYALNRWGLTLLGGEKARRMIRFHRLWEVYLVSKMHIDKKDVHKSAEKMEHILTPEIEKQLDAMLHSPQFDPHQKPIPQGNINHLKYR